MKHFKLRTFSILPLIVLPALVFGGSDKKKNEQVDPAGKHAEASATAPTNGKENLVWKIDSEIDDPALLQIAKYEVGIDEVNESRPAPLEFRTLEQVVNPFTVRKRGRFYGSLYFFHRNDNFDARNFFDPVGQPLPEYKRNQFGISIGSLVTDRLTIFGTYDGTRINRGATLVSHIPTAAMKGGNFSVLPAEIVDPATGAAFPNNRIPASRIHPVSAQMLATIPEPNRPDPSRNFVNNQPWIDNNDTFMIRVDYIINPDEKLFGNYRTKDSEEVDVHDLPAFGLNEVSGTDSFTLNYAKTFNPSLLSTSRISFYRSTGLQLSTNVDQQGLLESLGIAGLEPLDGFDEGYPQFGIAGYASLGLSSRMESPQTSFRNYFQFEQTVTYVRGNHQLFFGAEFELRQVNNARSGGLRRGRFGFDGGFTGDAFADFLLGLPTSAERGVGSDRGDLRKRAWRAFLRDDWKINPKLNLSASLTYNFSPVYRSVHDNISIFLPLVFEPPEDGELVIVGSERAEALGLPGLPPGHGVYPDKNDWEPRLGLAYSPLGDNRLVLRGSYQLSYDPLDSRRALFYMGRNFPFYYREKADATDSPDLDMSNPFDSVTPTELTIRALDPHMRTEYLQEWRSSLQNEFLRNWNFELSYFGTKQTRENRTLPANVPLPGSGQIQPRRPNPNFGEFSIVTGSGSTLMHAMNVDVRKRYDAGFSLQSGFTWVRRFTDLFSGDPQNPRNLRAERAPSTWYPNKRFYANYILDLPVGKGKAVSTGWAGKLGWVFDGWRLSGITSIQTGDPFHPILSGDFNNDGLTRDRPDRIGSGTLDPSVRSIDQWFAVDDFALPPALGFGTSGRNILQEPGEHTWDISIIKRSQVSDNGDQIELRVQLFNAFNHTNFERPDRTFGTTTFGQVFGAKDAREIEIALKYTF